MHDRPMPQAAIDRNIGRDVERIERARVIPETGGAWGDVKEVLTWLRGNEMSMIADFFVDSMIDRRFDQFYVDDRVDGPPVSSAYSRGRVSRRDAMRAVWRLHELLAQRRRNPRGSRKQYRVTAKHRKLLRVVETRPFSGNVAVLFWDGMAINVHPGHGVKRFYAMKPYDTRYEGREPGPDTRRAMQYIALETVYGRNMRFYVDLEGNVYADPEL